MRSADPLFFPSVLLFSLAASYTDIRLHRVPNSLIFRILAVSLFLNLLYFIDTGEGLLVYLAFVAVSALASLVLYLVDFWKPGDVKFYTALSTLVHPTEFSQFLLPLLGFLLLSIAATIVEAAVTRKFRFDPKPSVGMLLPVAVAPLMPLLGVSSLAVIFVMFFIGEKVKRLKLPILAVFFISLLLFPLQAIKALLFTVPLFLASSFKFEGHFPSVPFISASFIYLLASGKI